MTSSKTYLRKNLALAWPLAVNVLLVQSMFMIDTLLVAPLGEVPVAAMGIAVAIIAIALGVLMAIGNGIQLLVGRAHGSNNYDDLVVAFWIGLLITVATSLLFFVALAFFAPEVIGTLSRETAVEKQAVNYLSILKYLILFTAITQVCTAFYNGRGNTRVALKGFMIEIPVNAILSYFLIYGVGIFGGLGLEGAAWGSLVAVILRTIYFCRVLNLDENLKLAYPKGRAIFTEIHPQMAEIFPIAINFVVLFIGASVYQLLYAQLDLVGFVAITLIFPWLRLGTQFVSAWAQASAINISQALGDGNIQHLNLFVSVCVQTVLALSVFVAMLFFLLSQCIHFIYPNIAPETHLALAVIAPLYILLPLFRGYNSLSGNVLRALGESKRVLKLNFTAQWLISLPACALLILYFNVSLFWAFAIMPIEELLKVYHFHRYTKEKLASLSSELT